MLNFPLRFRRLAQLGLAGLLLLTGTYESAQAADPEVQQLVTTGMSAQVRPEVQTQLRGVAMAVFMRTTDAPAALVQLQTLIDGGTLNYWETFEALMLLAQTSNFRGAYAEAQAAWEKCLNFTDIDALRRREALTSLGEFYVARKEYEKALAIFEELSDLRGGRDSRTLMRIATVHNAYLGDPVAAIPYVEAAIRHETGTPKRSQYALLRRAYQHAGELEKALDVAKAMVDLFDYASDADAMDKIIADMNRQDQ